MTLQQWIKLKKALVLLMLILLSIVFIFPFLWLFTTALKPIEQTMKEPPLWIPDHFLWLDWAKDKTYHVQWNNFWDAMVYGRDTLGYAPFLIYARNTLVICVLIVSGTVVSNALVAYSFARLKWPGRDLIFALTLA